MQFLDPRNEIAFKKIFGSEDHKGITISFLNSILEYTGDRIIVAVQFMNTEQHPLIQEKKENFLDILCTDQSGNRYIIEMQVARIEEFGKRMVYYGAKAYAMQLGKARPYYELSPVITIAIVDFTLFPHKSDYKSIHEILDKKTHEHDLRGLSFVFIELTKFTKKEPALQSAEDKWIYFIKEISKQDHVPEPLAKAEFKEACHVAERIQWSEPEMNAYERALIKSTDVELSIKAGREEGREEGRDKAILENIEKMLTEGLAIDLIIRITGLSLEQINELKRKYKSN